MSKNTASEKTAPEPKLHQIINEKYIAQYDDSQDPMYFKNILMVMLFNSEFFNIELIVLIGLHTLAEVLIFGPFIVGETRFTC